jgi:hypothetical protein
LTEGKPPQRVGGRIKSVSEKMSTKIGPSTKFGSEMPSIASAIEA